MEHNGSPAFVFAGSHERGGLSTGQELGPYEEPSGWIHDGVINNAFASFAYFCGVLAAPRVIELNQSDCISPSADNVSYQRAPAFIYSYPEDFPAAGQFVIEAARLEENSQLESKGSRTYEEYIAARVDWFWQLTSVVASVLGGIDINQQWSVKRRRDTLADFGFRAAEAVGIPHLLLHKLMASERWSALNECVIPLRKAVSPGTVASSPSPVPDEMKNEGKTRTSYKNSVKRGSRRQTPHPDKGNLELLRGPDGKQKELVNLGLAARFGGVGERAIQKAIRKGALESEGERVNRRIKVSSLLKYFPSENNAN